MAAHTYGDGTISVDQNSATVTGTGTAWSTQVMPGDRVVAVVSGAWVTVGWVEEVDGDLELTLQDQWTGSAISGAAYRIEHGIGHLAGGAVAAMLVDLLARLGAGGTVGTTTGTPASSDGRNSDLRIDPGTSEQFQKRSGDWAPVIPCAPSYTFATMPDPTGPGQLIYVTDTALGARVCYSDGSTWRYVQNSNEVAAA